MSEPIDDGGPAFPYSALVPDDRTAQLIGTMYADNEGMSLRDYFAAKALPSTLSASSSGEGCYDYVAAAVGAYLVADAMIAARAPKKEPTA